MAKLDFDKIDSAIDDFGKNVGYLEKIKDVCDSVTSAAKDIQETQEKINMTANRIDDSLVSVESGFRRAADKFDTATENYTGIIEKSQDTVIYKSNKIIELSNELKEEVRKLRETTDSKVYQLSSEIDSIKKKSTASLVFSLIAAAGILYQIFFM